MFGEPALSASCFLHGDTSLIVVDNLPLLLVAARRKFKSIIWHQLHSPKAALTRDLRFHLVATQRRLPSRASGDEMWSDFVVFYFLVFL